MEKKYQQGLEEDLPYPKGRHKINLKISITSQMILWTDVVLAHMFQLFTQLMNANVCKDNF